MPPQRPNLLLITTDTHRVDALGCMGSPFAHSPSLDRLAREGVLFTQAHTAAPACMPARCSLMSGLHTPLHQCLENGMLPREDMPFFTEELERLGYITIMVGKTHFGPVPASFARRFVAEGEKGAESQDWFAARMKQAGYSRASREGSDVPEEYRLDSLIVDRTIACMGEAAAAQKPFFAFCSILSPHAPIDPPGEWAQKYGPADIPPASYQPGEWQGLPSLVREICGIPAREGGSLPQRLEEARGNVADALSQEEIRRYKAAYYGSAAWCDHLVGRLMAYLEEARLRENTLVVFTSDHGQQLFDHGFNDKHNYYDQSMRVPLIMSMPSRLPQGERREFASATDIAPTLAAAAGGRYEAANGYDLFTPLCQGEPLPRNAAAASLYRCMALVTRRWKLEYYVDEDAVRLFDRQRDPGEDRDLAGEEAYEQVRDKLLRILLRWHAGLEDVGRQRRRQQQGGPVARRVAKRVQSRAGRDCEAILEEAARL